MAQNKQILSGKARTVPAAKKPVPTNKTRTGSSKATSPARKPQKSQQNPQGVVKALQALSPQQKQMLIGLSILALGILILLIFILASKYTLSQMFAQGILKALGWIGYLLPFILITGAIWFLFSKGLKNPKRLFPRLVGLSVLLLDFFAWANIIGGNLNPAGGGLIGQALYRILRNAFGNAATIILLLAFLILGLILLFDLPISEIVYRLVNHAALKKQQRLDEQLGKESVFQASSFVAPSQFAEPPSPSDPPPASVATGDPSKAKTSAPRPTKKPNQNWILPNPRDFLSPIIAPSKVDDANLERAHALEECLRSHSAPGTVVDIQRGPAVTMFGFQPGFFENTGDVRRRVPVRTIGKLKNDIAMALKASSIRIQSPVPGKDYIGIEVPNQVPETVQLLDLLESKAYKENRAPLKFPLGKDVTGQAYICDIADFPHAIIAGTTGSGKSVCLNAIIVSYLFSHSPDELRLILVDPKISELTPFNGIPHLFAPVITNPLKVIPCLEWLTREMDLRYQMLSKCQAQDIEEYNQIMRRNGDRIMAYILVVIDEFADLMAQAPNELENQLRLLAQKSRGVGIHIILSTQRPSRDVITGGIKANCPARIAFSVATNIDSRVVLDDNGAEHLLKAGDMLFKSQSLPSPIRLKGPYISNKEINAIVQFWHKQALTHNQAPAPSPTPQTPDPNPFIAPMVSNDPLELSLSQQLQQDSDEDELMQESINYVRQQGRASSTMLQRAFGIGYSRAARLLDKMEERGIISPPVGRNMPRRVVEEKDRAENQKEKTE